MKEPDRRTHLWPAGERQAHLHMHAKGFPGMRWLSCYRLPRGNIYFLHFPHHWPWPVSASGLAWLAGSLRSLSQPPMISPQPPKDPPFPKTPVLRVRFTREPRAAARSLPSVSRRCEDSKASLPLAPLSTRAGERALPGQM